MEAALGHFASGNLKKKRLFFFGKKNVEYRGSEVPDLGYPLSRAPDRPWAFHHASPYKVVYRGTLGSDNFCGLGVPSGVLDPRSRIWPKTPGIACFGLIWPPLAKTRTLPSNRERTPILVTFAHNRSFLVALRSENNFWKNTSARDCFSFVVVWFC